MQGVRLGRTIVAERERAESDSERMMARKKAHRKQKTSIIIVLLMAVVLGLAFYIGMDEFLNRREETTTQEVEKIKITAQIVDEDNRGQISTRTRSYIAQLEQDLRELGYRVTKVTLPTGMSRELFVDLDGRPGYFKVNLDRATAVTAEDIDRMVRYLAEKEIVPEYVDVRIDGKAYYK